MLRSSIAIPTLVAALIIATAVPAIAAGWHHRGVRTRIVVGPRRAMTKVVVIRGQQAAALDFNVKPKSTRIFVDGTYRGTCDEFDGFPQKMHLAPGTHRIRLVTPDGESATQTVQLVRGFEVNLNLRL